MPKSIKYQIVFASIFLINSIGNADPRLVTTGLLFREKDEVKDTPIFRFKSEMDSNKGTKTFLNTYTDTTGKIALVETVQVRDEPNSTELLSYDIKHDQIGAVGSAVIKNNKLQLSYSVSGKTKTNSEDLEPNTVAPATILPTLRKNWDQIVKGQHIKVRLIVLDRLETVGFELFKEKEVNVDGQKLVQIKMKPTNFVIAAAVDPIFFLISDGAKRIAEARGRASVKIPNEGKLTDAAVVSIYQDAKNE